MDIKGLAGVLVGTITMLATAAVSFAIYHSRLGSYKVGLWSIMVAIFFLGLFFFLEGIAQDKSPELTS